MDESHYTLYKPNPKHHQEVMGQHSSHSIEIFQFRKKVDKSASASRATATHTLIKAGDVQEVICSNQQLASTEPYCHIKLASIMKLKDSTKKLLFLLEKIQAKTHTKGSETKVNVGRPIPEIDIVNSVTDVCASALKKIEAQTKILETIPIENEDDDCSVFKRLTRKCHCLNQHEYNDFMIHFNEDSKYFTSNTGEIIKNLRILKKFLYMGGGYCKHALMFLTQGFEDSSFNEKVEISEGCAHADICNVFDDVSIVITCIAWPYKYDTYVDTVTQELAAVFLYDLAQFEEGRRYLTFTSKISNDIKKVLRKKGGKLNFKTFNSLQATLNAINPQNVIENNDTTFSKLRDEGYGLQTIKALTSHRKFMTLDEIFTHLDLLEKWSSKGKGSTELTKSLKPLLLLFKEMLMTYNDSEMNIIISNILNNLLTGSYDKFEIVDIPKIMMVANIATEPTQTKSNETQIPESMPEPRKLITKKHYKSKRNLHRAGHEKQINNGVIVVPLEETKQPL